MNPVTTNNYFVINTNKDDLDFVYHLFEEAINYQKEKKYTVYNGYDKEGLLTDIEKQLQYKIVSGSDILCIFSICFNDTVIWRERENNDAVYLHRIVVNPKFKGQKQFDKVLKWAKQLILEKKLKYIRMDTWADNQNIIDYYKSFGFRFVENYTTPDTLELPIQHRNLSLALLELNSNKIAS